MKRARGSDLIVVKLDGETDGAMEALNRIPQVSHVDGHGQELTISVANGAAVISTVALALDQQGISVQELTLRTPTLDDVFLQVTGGRLRDSDPASAEESD